MSFTVEFKNVGRGKKTWRCNLPAITDQYLYDAVLEGRALMSRDIDFEYDEVFKCGTVYVGGGRKVGTFRVVDPDEIPVDAEPGS